MCKHVKKCFFKKLDRNFVSILYYISCLLNGHMKVQTGTKVNWSANRVEKKITMKFIQENVAFMFSVRIIHLS